MTTSSDPEEIRRQIELTQASISDDVDALSEKVTPRKIVGRRVDRARDTATRLKDKVMGADSAGDIGGHTTDRVSGTLSAAASSVTDATSTAAGSAHDAAAATAGAVQETPAAIRRQTRGNPLAAGVIAFGAGWLVSSLLPASRREQELADQAKQVAQDKIQPVAQQVAGEMGDNLREPAQHAVASVKSTAQDAGQTVADESRSAAQNVQGRAQDAADNVRGNT